MKATRTCSIPDCDRGGKIARGWCNTHYERWRKTGTVEERQARLCTIEGCEDRHVGLGYCNKHFKRFQAYGDALAPLRVGHHHPNWTGDAPTYIGAHARVRREKGLASAHSCGHCGEPAEDWAYDHLDQNEKRDESGRPYSGDPARYFPLCRVCHRRFDRGGESDETGQ